VLVHGCERSQIQPFGDLLIAGAVAPLFEEPGQEIEELFLPFGESHANMIGEEKGNRKRKI